MTREMICSDMSCNSAAWRALNPISCMRLSFSDNCLSDLLMKVFWHFQATEMNWHDELSDNAWVAHVCNHDGNSCRKENWFNLCCLLVLVQHTSCTWPQGYEAAIIILDINSIMKYFTVGNCSSELQLYSSLKGTTVVPITPIFSSTDYCTYIQFQLLQYLYLLSASYCCASIPIFSRWLKVSYFLKLNCATWNTWTPAEIDWSTTFYRVCFPLWWY